MTIRDCWGDPLDAESPAEWKSAWANRLRLRDEWDHKAEQDDAKRGAKKPPLPSTARDLPIR